MSNFSAIEYFSSASVLLLNNAIGTIAVAIYHRYRLNALVELVEAVASTPATAASAGRI